jgi:hypothetical protein
MQPLHVPTPTIEYNDATGAWRVRIETNGAALVATPHSLRILTPGGALAVAWVDLIALLSHVAEDQDLVAQNRAFLAGFLSDRPGIRVVSPSGNGTGRHGFPLRDDYDPQGDYSAAP